MTTLQGRGALPDRMEQRGHGALAAWGARALRSPAPEPAGEPSFHSGGRAQIFIFAFLLRVTPASALTTGQDRVHSQPAAPQGWKQGLSDKLCPPGSHASEDGERCINCTNGVDYTIYWNKLFSCLLCAKCKPDEEEIMPCTRTKNTQCQCERGFYLGEESPEFCQRCSPGCPDGMVESEPCTPWSNLKCVKQGSGTQAIGEAPVPGEPVTTSLGPHNAPSPSSGSSQLVIGMAVVAVCVVLLLVLIACAYYHRRRICQGLGVDPECINRVIFWRSCPPREPGALDNARNEIVSNTGSLSMQASEQELGHQEHAELEGVLIQSPEEAEHLLEPAEAEGSQMKKGLLVPANDADPIKSLRLVFDYFTNVVPFNSWNPLMRLLGLSDNDICVARAQASHPREALYEMLVTWINIKGRDASVNTLLKALETLGERRAKELIQDHLVDSGKYVYEEDGAGSALS
ncbi:tumor necrosis factor receptor superfamily member 10B isoform 2-T2 [Hipposideros larvatus]